MNKIIIQLASNSFQSFFERERKQSHDFSMLAKQKSADTLLPVCSSVNGSSGGLAGAQRACFLVRLWVLPIGLTLMWPKECATHTPNYALAGNKQAHINRALFRLAAELWPS